MKVDVKQSVVNGRLQVQIDLKGDLPGHPFRGNQWSGGYSPAKYASGDVNWVDGTEIAKRAIQDEVYANSHNIGSSLPEDKLLHDIADVQGFTAPAELVSKEKMDSLVADGYMELHRGVSDVSHAEELRKGEYYAGRGAGGSGIYFSPMTAMSDVYASGASIRAALDPKANKIDGLKMLGIQREMQKSNDPLIKILAKDTGRLAAAMGYDAIVYGKMEVVVLNRSALVIEQGN